MAEGNGKPRFFPIARGRVDWLGDGRIEVRQGPGSFGRALLVEVRALPSVECQGGDPRGLEWRRGAVLVRGRRASVM
jgi:hypothetical protein